MKMTGDASAYCIREVISHVHPDGSKWPIAYTSRALTTAEENYPQIGFVTGAWNPKIPQYLYRHKFVLVTDNEPLTTPELSTS